MPFEALIYHLTQLFHCTPSQILKEENDLMMNILTMHNLYQQVDEWRNDWKEKKLDAQMQIVLEIEKLKSKKA